jgi:hypothetical protein
MEASADHVSRHKAVEEKKSKEKKIYGPQQAPPGMHSATICPPFSKMQLDP